MATNCVPIGTTDCALHVPFSSSTSAQICDSLLVSSLCTILQSEDLVSLRNAVNVCGKPPSNSPKKLSPGATTGSGRTNLLLRIICGNLRSHLRQASIGRRNTRAGNRPKRSPKNTKKSHSAAGRHNRSLSAHRDWHSIWPVTVADQQSAEHPASQIGSIGAIVS